MHVVGPKGSIPLVSRRAVDPAQNESLEIDKDEVNDMYDQL